MSKEAPIQMGRKMQVFHGTRLLFGPRWQERLAPLGITAKGGWDALTRGVRVSGSSSITNCFRVRLQDGAVVYMKHYSYKKAKRWRFWLRASKAAVETWGFAEFAKVGIPTPEVLVYGERRKFGFLREALIVTREIERSMDLTSFAEAAFQPWLNEAIYDQIGSRLCSQLAAAHSARLFHRDLKWKNILIQETSDGYVPVWIDCPRASYKRILCKTEISRELASLCRDAEGYVSVGKRLEFFEAYLVKLAAGNLYTRVQQRNEKQQRSRRQKKSKEKHLDHPVLPVVDQQRI
jgi:tRNA A-37 threonylcarbamoyl transferase component Bud32